MSIVFNRIRMIRKYVLPQVNDLYWSM